MGKRYGAAGWSGWYSTNVASTISVTRPRRWAARGLPFMKLTLLPSALGAAGAPAAQYLSSALVNDTIALDAGCLGFHGTPDDQARVRHVLLTHSHLDHVASLPIFLENGHEGRGDGVNIYASAATLDALRRHFFNDQIWPDFVALSDGD